MISTIHIQKRLTGVYKYQDTHTNSISYICRANVIITDTDPLALVNNSNELINQLVEYSPNTTNRIFIRTSNSIDKEVTHYYQDPIYQMTYIQRSVYMEVGRLH